MHKTMLSTSWLNKRLKNEWPYYAYLFEKIDTSCLLEYREKCNILYSNDTPTNILKVILQIHKGKRGSSLN